MTLLPHADPAGIEAASLAIIDAEAAAAQPGHAWSGGQWEVVRRAIHTTADFDMLRLFQFHPRAVAEGVRLLRQGAAIVTDTEMCRAGIPARRRERFGNPVHCLMNDAEVMRAAAARGTTRAREAMRQACARWDGLRETIVAVGNAPTALLELLELTQSGQAAPGLVIAMPVGFVNAAESKALFLEADPCPAIAITGRKGGSALAAATVNALLDLALRPDTA